MSKKRVAPAKEAHRDAHAPGGTVGEEIREDDPRELGAEGDEDDEVHEGTVNVGVDSEEFEEVEASAEDLAKADALEAEAAALRENKTRPIKVHHDPNTHIGIGHRGEEHYMEAPPGWGHERSILVGGRSYEHTHDDEDGCWVYNHLDRHT